MANSSALQLADLALLWDDVHGAADLAIIDGDLASDQGLETAVVLSLFTDRRAEDDDVPPSGDSRDRRGWWADQFLANAGDKFGSRLWLLDRSTLSNETLLRAKQYALEALQWLVDDKVASSIDVTVTRLPNGMRLSPTVTRPGREAVTFSFAHVWDHQEDT